MFNGLLKLAFIAKCNADVAEPMRNVDGPRSFLASDLETPSVVLKSLVNFFALLRKHSSDVVEHLCNVKRLRRLFWSLIMRHRR